LTEIDPTSAVSMFLERRLRSDIASATARSRARAGVRPRSDYHGDDDALMVSAVMRDRDLGLDRILVETAELGFDVSVIVDLYETRTGIRRPRRRLVRGRLTKLAVDARIYGR
jgi:hypothetical protein